MPNERTDRQGFNTDVPDKDRTLASQGGPSVGLGNPTNRSATTPAGDTNTQLAAASAQQKKEKDQQQSQSSEGELSEDEVRRMEDQTP